MGLFRAIDIGASALSAEKLRLEVHLTNLANARTTRTPEGGPYQRQEVVFRSQPTSSFDGVLQGVEARVIRDVDAEPQMVFEPGHPDADEQGYLALPDVDPVTEQADIVAAARGYEANLAVIRVTKELLSKALEIGR